MSATDSFGLPQSRRWTDWQERSELLERLPAALCVCDAAGAIVDYNRRAAALWGREPRRGDGGETYCGFAAVIGAEGVALPRREWPMAQVLESGAAISDFEFLAERIDGARLAILASITPLFDDEGRLAGAVSCFLDVTERQRRARAAAEAQKFEALEQLAATVAHDMNNVLATVVLCLNLAIKRVEDPNLVKILRGAQHAAERGNLLTERLLTIARRQILVPRAADLSSLIESLRGALAVALGSEVQLELRLGEGLPPAVIDAVQIELALFHLVENAREAMPRGGRVTIATGHVALAESDPDLELAPGEYLTLTIADTGNGMPPAVLDRAGEPFFTTKEGGRAAGLGLSTALSIARQHGGRLRVRSRVGEGTVVELFLPRAKPADRPQPAAAAPCAVPAAQASRPLMLPPAAPEAAAPTPPAP